MLTTQDKAAIVAQFGGSEKDSGKPEVQIAIATHRIKYLTKHFEDHKLDHHSKRGLMKLIGRRRNMLKYLNSKSPERYQSVIKELGLRK